jgi:hypothetical protein
MIRRDISSNLPAYNYSHLFLTVDAGAQQKKKRPAAKSNRVFLSFQVAVNFGTNAV